VTLPDDCSLSASQKSRIRSEAQKALEKACAIGVFPTPISDIMKVADVEEVQENVLNESFIEKLRSKARGAGQLLRSALSKVLGIFHAGDRLIFIDHSLMGVRKSFIRLHECAHAILPWQRNMYAVVEDCEKSLDPFVADDFDREANGFASEVLFQLDSFITESNDTAFGIFNPVKLSRKYGSSIYAAIRQYVSKNNRACIVLIIDPPEVCNQRGFKANMRRVVASPSFTEKFGELAWPQSFSPDDTIGAMIPINKRKSSGKRNVSLIDRNGVTHECTAEAFTQSYQVFILICSIKTMTDFKIVMS
jgi:hypothetical protein